MMVKASAESVRGAIDKRLCFHIDASVSSCGRSKCLQLHLFLVRLAEHRELSKACSSQLQRAKKSIVYS